MLRSEPMQKVRLVCLERDRRNMVSALHKVGIIDLRRSRLDLKEDNPESYFTALSDVEIRLAGAIALLNKPKGNPRKVKINEKHINAEELLSKLSKLAVIERIYKLSDERKESRQRLRHIEQSEDVARQLSGVDIDLSSLKSRTLDFKAYAIHNKSDAASLKEEIAKKGLAMEVIESGLKNQSSIFVAYKKGMDIGDFERRYGLKELDISLDYLHGTPANALRHIARDREKEQKTIKSIGEEIAGISKTEYWKLSAFMEMLEIEMAKAGVSGTFKKTERTVIIEGWVPKKRMDELDGVVGKASMGRYHIEEIQTDELAPTLTNRPKILQPFDYMISFISVPRSDELDPALPFIISFPIFYGLMVTDVGYGLLSLLFATYITKITDPEGLVYNTSKIWQISSISAIFFGFLSNQYFGLQLNQYFTSFVGFDWLKSVTAIILISVIFGIIQVVIGLIFGFINNYKHHRSIAFGRLTSVVLILSGTVAVAGGLFNVVSPTITLVSAGIAIASLVATIILSGEEAGEITNLISHPLSYARIMGFGLASVVLAFLIDKAFTPRISLGIPLFILYLVLFIVLHFLNMIVTMFEAAVQGARLNFIEFFTKFYKGGGIRFKPFASKRIYTKE